MIGVVVHALCLILTGIRRRRSAGKQLHFLFHFDGGRCAEDVQHGGRTLAGVMRFGARQYSVGFDLRTSDKQNKSNWLTLASTVVAVVVHSTTGRSAMSVRQSGASYNGIMWRCAGVCTCSSYVRRRWVAMLLRIESVPLAATTFGRQLVVGRESSIRRWSRPPVVRAPMHSIIYTTQY